MIDSRQSDAFDPGDDVLFSFFARWSSFFRDPGSSISRGSGDGDGGGGDDELWSVSDAERLTS